MNTHPFTPPISRGRKSKFDNWLVPWCQPEPQPEDQTIKLLAELRKDIAAVRQLIDNKETS